MKQLNFGKIKTKLALPDLLEMQRQSFTDFLQLDTDPAKRELKGLQAAFEDVFPIEAPDGSMKLDFVKYELAAPKYATSAEANVKDGTFSAPLKAWMRLYIKQKNGSLKEVKEEDISLCELPLMTEAGCFVFNGAERVVVSQLHRSPGIIFEEDEEKKQSTLGKKLYVARIIPYRGAWVEFQFDLANVLWVRIDRKKKVLATTFLRACGLESNAEILQAFYPVEEVDIKVSEVDSLVGRYAAEDIIDPATGEVIWNLDDKAATPIDDKTFKLMLERKVKKVKILAGNPRQDNPGILATLEAKKEESKTSKEAQFEIYKRLRGQDFIVKEQAEQFLDSLLFNNVKRYDLSYVGRYKINKKFGYFFDSLAKAKFRKFIKPADKRRTLAMEDVIVTVQYLLALNAGEEYTAEAYKNDIEFKLDDIDHLGNRRVRGIGELLENQIRVGLSQMAKTARDRMNKEASTQKPTPRALVNAQPVAAIIRKFFGTSQLSQFMDQINPLSELTHKRRLSALGPGGLNRKRAGFEVRDVHHTHYGRLCPIETPEGPNIGLITSLACYSRVNKYGLLESPFRKVDGVKVTDKVDYLTADIEDDYMVAQSNTPLTEAGKFATEQVACRLRSDYPIVAPAEVDYMDISPLQVISVSAALIPFLEHDDANRALMGCNMQRQAVPLLLTDAPLVGTGIEDAVAKDSGSTMVAKQAGTVIFASADIIAVEPANGGKLDIYELTKYKRSNQDTCINHKPLVKVGDVIKAGQVLVDGPAMQDGVLSLGRNLLVGFMSWEGYNYEDAILISSKLVKDDILTSVHLHEFSTDARNTKLGAEEITRDIPNIGTEALSHLDDDGIIIPSTVVGPGDILVGKVTPKGEQQLTPEERLLKVIFGKKADDVVDASLRVPPGTNGKVIGTRVFVRKEKLTKLEEKAKLKALEAEKEANLATLQEQKKRALDNIKQTVTKAAEQKKAADSITNLYKLLEKRLLEQYEREKAFSSQGDELAVTVNKSVKVFIASKRKVQVGDKLSGRHGNKGVVAKIMPEEDMPFLPDGTPLDIILSPLGIPSRMNVGQLFETMLGWAAHHLDIHTATPVFDGPSEEEVKDQVRKAKAALVKKGVPERYLPDDYCRITLFDGRTGEPFAEKVTIGYMYIMKLIHLVEDKVHSRSTGPYSLITRQPLGGKAQFGGQRFGEMEVWAIEGYGATYTLQEFLTVKSDDFTGRTKMYESIVKGELPSQPGVPESFKVLVKELQALGISVELLKERAEEQIIDISDKSDKGAAAQEPAQAK
ncbi:MAG: DNA-directed RNA polymerase subunit beta [Elusimicrobiota bacterium]|jgi:DNA-directed RNA polymerase subunit beta|nr:DNA-directed RNA polymerase subunit beta [Elusimicrobiota bacterium]